ncbi:MAG: hypothetical protein E7505_10900 [Ruminococcus sp.]|nr:hypothetical protein [Ruminococcus sp.]
MKIKSIYIKNFGGLKNFRLDLKQGLNVIYGDNEAGKTTVMSFIRMMFYGTSGKSSDISKNPRKKYAPWDGSPMSGFIEFQHNGINYRLEREFKSSNISDTITLWNLDNGTNESMSCKYDAGERFMGMGADAFEKSVFIGGVSSVIKGTDKDDELSKKLMNYSLSGDETVSYELVRKRLIKAHEELRSKSGKNGELDKLLQTLSDKTEKLSEAEEEENQKFSDEELYTSFCDHLRKKKEYHDRISDNIKEQHIIRELHSLEVQNKKNIVKEDLKKKLRELSEDISNGSFTVTDLFLDECEEMLSGLNRLKETYAEKKVVFNSLSNEISDMQLSERIHENYVDLDSLSDQIDTVAQKLTEKETELQAVSDSIEDLKTKLKETQLKEELYKEHLADMEPSYLSLIPVTAFIIGAIALLFKNPLILIAIIPGCAAVFGTAKIIEKITDIKNKKSGIIKKEPDYEQVYKDFDEVREQYDNQYNEVSSQISDLKKEHLETSKKKSQLEIENNKLVLMNDQKISELNRINSALSRISSDISELDIRLVSFFSSYKNVSGVHEIEQYIADAQNTLSEIEKTKAVLDSKLEEDVINDNPEEIRKRMTALRSKLQLLTGENGPKLLTDEQTDSLEEELEVTKKEIASLKDEVSNMRSRIQSHYHSHENPSTLRNDIDAIKKDIKEATYYDKCLLIAAETLEEAGNEIRQTFTPELNTKTERIFRHLTNGKYTETIVSKNFDITSAQNADSSLREWQYLSTGTSEQAYFSLRLALADMITKNQVPLFLDDVFAHYDDERAKKGFSFLKEYSRLNQVLFFTCHKYNQISENYISFPEK